ncbi:MAG: nuclease-related domain-containing protein [Streptosporangiaceae bacterium]
MVIGPFGMVTINTKTTRTSVWVGEFGMVVGRTKVDYLRKSRAEARRAGALISRAAGWPVPVQPVIVFVGARRFSTRRGGPADVAVLPSARALRRWLHKQRGTLDARQVEAIYAAARRPGTWQRPPRSSRPRRA